jgi:hypothetical protein
MSEELNNAGEINWGVIPNLFMHQYVKNLLIFNMNLGSFKSLLSTEIQIPTFYKIMIDMSRAMTKPT